MKNTNSNSARRGMAKRFFHTPGELNHGTAYIRLNTKDCTACWECISACPNGVISKMNMFFHKHAVIANAAACTGCLVCIGACESKAIIQV